MAVGSHSAVHDNIILENVREIEIRNHFLRGQINIIVKFSYKSIVD